MDKFEFDAILEKHENMDATYIVFPYSVNTVFGVKGQVKVKALIDGVLYRGSLATMGYKFHCLGVTKEIRKLIAKNPGDSVHIIIERDHEERIIDIPLDLTELLNQNQNEKIFFEKLSYSNKKEYVNWIIQSKKDETRQNRLKKVIEMLSNKKKNPTDKKI